MVEIEVSTPWRVKEDNETDSWRDKGHCKTYIWRVKGDNETRSGKANESNERSFRRIKDSTEANSWRVRDGKEASSWRVKNGNEARSWRIKDGNETSSWRVKDGNEISSLCVKDGDEASSYGALENNKTSPIDRNVDHAVIFDFPFIVDDDTISFIKDHRHIMFIIRGPPFTKKTHLSNLMRETYYEAVYCSAVKHIDDNKAQNSKYAGKTDVTQSHKKCEHEYV